MCIWVDILCIYVYTGRHEFILFFSFFFCLYLCMCVLYLFSFLFSVCTPLTSYLIHISYVLNMFGFFFFFYIFLFFVHVYYQEDIISPSWARAACKKTLSLIHYPCEIKFIHLFIHSFILCKMVFLFQTAMFLWGNSIFHVMHLRTAFGIKLFSWFCHVQQMRWKLISLYRWM